MSNLNCLPHFFYSCDGMWKEAESRIRIRRVIIYQCCEESWLQSLDLECDSNLFGEVSPVVNTTEVMQWLRHENHWLWLESAVTWTLPLNHAVFSSVTGLDVLERVHMVEGLFWVREEWGGRGVGAPQSCWNLPNVAQECWPESVPNGLINNYHKSILQMLQKISEGINHTKYCNYL